MEVYIFPEMIRRAKLWLSAFFHAANCLPLVYVAALILLAVVLRFNGLYGQDSHEYLHLSRAYFQLFQGIPYVPEGLGDAEFAVGYPLAAAILRILMCQDVLALQVVSWLSAGAALWQFDACLRILTPGAQRWSRMLFAGIGLGLSGYFVRAGLTSMSDALGLALTLGACRYALSSVVRPGAGADLVRAAILMGAAVITRYSLAALMLPLAIGSGWFFLEKRRAWHQPVLAVVAGFLMLIPHFWLKKDVPASPLEHSLLQDWSLLHLFHSTFTNASGTISYPVPNIVYLLFPLAHPGFMFTLPLLFLLGKKTDLLLPTKRLVLVCILLYLLFLGGIPHQNLRYLLPAFALLLLLFFPAWDRFVCYGFYFFKKLTLVLLAVAVLVQVFFTVKTLAPTIARNRLEKQMAYSVGQWVDPSIDGAAGMLFAFDLDIALRSYLPKVRFFNLWEKRYDDFPAGSFILFNEPRLRQQWQGQNPMLNWGFAVEHFELLPVQELPEGWTLYRVIKRK